MACFYPLPAWQTTAGEVIFSEDPRRDIHRSLQLPCGQCLGCRLERSRQWAMRCMHEAALHKQNCFVTLTYDESNVPFRNQLDYRQFQAFFKRLRQYHYRQWAAANPEKHKSECPRIKFYMCGEYGDTNGRPHYHAIIFGFNFADRVPFRLLVENAKLYTSKALSRLWPHGHCTIGSVTFESAAYVARYCLKKVTGKAAEEWYAREDEHGKYFLTPEFAHMSLKPGVGASWLSKFQSDVYPRNYVVVNGIEVKPPKYYDRLMEKVMPHDIDVLKFERQKLAERYLADCTPERLAVREVVTKARLDLKKRGI